MAVMIRLGVATRILGKAGLRARTGRHAAAASHLSAGLLVLREVLFYLAEQQIACYRLADDLLTWPGEQEAARQLDACADLLAETGALARAQGIRLTLHAPLHVALASPDRDVAARSARHVVALAELLDALGPGLGGAVVLHIGGAHGDPAAALVRFAARYERLPANARRRIAIEHDEHCFALVHLLRLHQLTGAPLVFDWLHHQLNDPAEIPVGEALGLALATWPRGLRPKVHFSTQRTEAHLLAERRGQPRRVLAPALGQHSDYVNPFEFAAFVMAARGLPGFDVMLEAKAADLALLRLRDDLARFAPQLAATVDVVGATQT
jgi:UV DNA damage endonuclease